MSDAAVDKLLKSRGGRRRGAGGKKGSKKVTPAALAKRMLPVEVDILPPQDRDYALKAGYIDPVEFCLALVNNDVALLKKLGVNTSSKKGPSLGQRIEAARIAIPYTNRKLPTEIHATGSVSFVAAVQEGENRIQTMRKQYVPPNGDEHGSQGAIH